MNTSQAHFELATISSHKKLAHLPRIESRRKLTLMPKVIEEKKPEKKHETSFKMKLGEVCEKIYMMHDLSKPFFRDVEDGSVESSIRMSMRTNQEPIEPLKKTKAPDDDRSDAKKHRESFLLRQLAV